MGSKIDVQSDEAEKAVADIRRATRRHFSAEDKVRIEGRRRLHHLAA